jgi:hypothetical protein
MPNAEHCRDRVVEEVPPEIGRTGGYKVPARNILDAPKFEILKAA